jgi:histidinol-phosphatase (PHP family)
MLDYHLHLWPHGERHRAITIDELASYCEAARAQGITEIALTEHLFRFVQADATLHGFWEDDTGNPYLQEQASEYWREHQGADLDAYVDTVLEAKDAGLPIVLGLEVDYYRGRMDKVQALLDDYPFDVLLGSVHWLGAWMFDVLESDVAQEEWDRRGIARAWDAYTKAIEELSASGAVDVLAHPDLCKVANRRPSTPEEFYDRIAEAAASSNLAAEVSSAGWRKPCNEPYPAASLLQRFRARDVPITTASDAHSHDLVSHRVRDLEPMIREAGYTDLAAFSARDHQPVPI